MIKYQCRYCGESLGEFEQTNEIEKELGLDSLTQSERQDIITYMPDGDIIAKVTCDFCQDTLEKNPELSLISNPLQ